MKFRYINAHTRAEHHTLTTDKMKKWRENGILFEEENNSSSAAKFNQNCQQRYFFIVTVIYQLVSS